MSDETLILSVDNYFDAARGLYWYCSSYHGGQASDLYRIMCALDYHPGASERAPAPPMFRNLPADHTAGDFDDSQGEDTSGDFYTALVAGELDPQTLADSIKLILDTKD